MADVVMPRLSDSMEEGTILQWLKQVGDEVAIGDELVEIETDKANMAYEADVAGTLSEILVQEGETVAIGTPIARVGGERTDERARPRVLSLQGTHHPLRSLKRPRGRFPLQRHPRKRRLSTPLRRLPKLQAETVESRRLPWRSGSPGSAASIWGSLRGPGRGDGSSRRMSRRLLPRVGRHLDRRILKVAS